MMDLFDDLPEPVNDGVVANASEQSTELVVSPNETCAKKRTLQESGFYPSRDTKRRCSLDSLILKGYVAERKGERVEMQDAHVIFNDYKSFLPHALHHQIASQVAFYGVYDGHGGTRASNFAASNLHNNLAQTFPKGDVTQLDRDVKKYFTDAYKKTDEDFLKEATKQKPSWKDGTTALTILSIGDTLYIANLGDSKAVLCRYDEEQDKNLPVILSKDHNPSDYNERMRIQKMGGQVKDGRVMGILEVSRSIGDGQYKTYGVICIPEIKRCRLTPEDRFIIMACDGLWKVFTAEMAVDFIWDALKDPTLKATESKCFDEVRFEAACARLANEAVRKGSGDNVTVLLISVHFSYENDSE